jgi:hypothetical protein
VPSLRKELNHAALVEAREIRENWRGLDEGGKKGQAVRGLMTSSLASLCAGGKRRRLD